MFDLNMADFWGSTVDLPVRFGLEQIPERTARKFFEEIGEFDRAAIIAEIDHDLANQSEACKEGADVMVMVMQRLNSIGITWEQFQPFIEYTIDKNDSKTPYTHEVLNGIITKKVDYQIGIPSDPT